MFQNQDELARLLTIEQVCQVTSNLFLVSSETIVVALEKNGKNIAKNKNEWKKKERAKKRERKKIKKKKELRTPLQKKILPRKF